MKVLVVVDMQNDFIDGSLGTQEAQGIVTNVCNEIVRRADKDTVILFTRDTHPENYMDTLEGKNLPISHCIEGTHGWEINDAVWGTYVACADKYMNSEDIVYPFAINQVIDKPTFGSMDLQNVLFVIEDSVAPIEEITLMGLCTGICVMSNAILCKATLPEVPVNVVENCSACVTPDTHKTAIEAMKLCQINII